MSKIADRRSPNAARWSVIFIVAAAAAGCSRAADTTNMTELQQVRSGTVDVVLLSPRDALRHGKDTFFVEFRSASDGTLVDAGNVRATANMPMPGMAMFGNIEVQPTSVPGRYAANSEFEMAGTWRMAIEWDGPSGKGSVAFSGTVQ
jgi:hypothetical protein